MEPNLPIKSLLLPSDQIENQANLAGGSRGAAIVFAAVYGLIALATTLFSYWAQSSYITDYSPISLLAAFMVPSLVILLGWLAVDRKRFQAFYILSPVLITIYLAIFAFKVDELILMPSWSMMCVLFALTLSRRWAFMILASLAFVLLLAAYQTESSREQWLLIVRYQIAGWVIVWLVQALMHTNLQNNHELKQRSMLAISLLLVITLLLHYMTGHSVATIVAGVSLFYIILQLSTIRSSSSNVASLLMILFGLILLFVGNLDLIGILNLLIVSIVVVYLAMSLTQARVIVALGLLLLINSLVWFASDMNEPIFWRAIRASVAVWLALDFFMWRRESRNTIEDRFVLPFNKDGADFFKKHFIVMFLIIFITFIAALSLWLKPAYSAFQNQQNTLRKELFEDTFSNANVSDFNEAFWMKLGKA